MRAPISIIAAVSVLGLAAMVSVPSTARAQTCAPTAQVCLQPVGTIGLTSGGLPVCACAGLYGWGAATEPDGSVLIGDYWNFRIQHYAANGTLLGTAVPPGGHEAPYGIAVDPNDGSIYFGDVDHNPPDVQKYSAAGQFLYAITTPKTGKFNYPGRVAVASDGTVFVSDMRANVIDVFTNTGAALATFGSIGSGPGQFDAPRGIAIDAANDLYVADNYNHRIEVFSESGAYLRQFGSVGTAPGQFGGKGDLRGVAIDNARGLIYVADDASGYVNQYSLTTGVYTGVRFGGFGAANGKFGDGPREITVDGAGNVWVGDLANFRVQAFSPSGAFLFAEPNPPQPPATGGFNGAMGVTIDAKGDVWALDRYNQRVEEFDPNGKFLMQFGKRGGGPDGMNYDRAIAYDPNDQTIYVADTDNQSVKKYDLKGNFICQVGVFGTGLGQFNEPQGIDVGSDGTVYVADSLNQRVQVLAPNSCTAVSAFGIKGTNPDGDFEFLRSVEVDPTDGSLWTADQTLGVVEHFTSTGTWLSSFGSSGSAGNQFNQPSDIVLDGNYVLVSDTATNDIKIWTKQGQFVEAYGGFGTALGDFAGPYGMAFAPDGNLYVMEQQNDRIQVLSVSLGGGVGPAAKLAFTQEPSSSNAGAAFPTQPTVAVEDSNGKIVTTDSSAVTLAITAGTGSSGAQLSCASNPLNASSGVAAFNNCAISKAGTGYTLTATDGTLTAAISTSLNVTSPPTGNPYTAITPFRVCDTRPATSGIVANQCDAPGNGPIGALTPRVVTIQGFGSPAVPAGATAVVVNVTAIAPTKATFVTLYPDLTSNPGTSNLNVPAGQVVANLVEVGLSSGGKIDVLNAAGTINVALDIEGFVSPGSTGLYNALPSPMRVCDTRLEAGIPPNQCNGNGTIASPIVAGSPRTINVHTLSDGVPATGVAAVVFNLTAIDPTQNTFVTAYPSNDVHPPGSSNINLNAGTVLPNRVIVPVSPSGQITIVTSVGSVHVAVDIDGWFQTTTGKQFTPLTRPFRVCNTQTGNPADGGETTGCIKATVSGGTALNIDVTGIDGIPQEGDAGAPTAIVANVTAVDATTGTYITVYPGPKTSPVPNASDLNVATSLPVPNLVVVTVDSVDGTINLYNASGNVNLIVDICGYYS